MENSSRHSGVLWFVAGAALGASLAVIFAPASGKDMIQTGRNYLDRGRQWAEQAADLFEKGSKIIDDLAVTLQQEKA